MPAAGFDVSGARSAASEEPAKIRAGWRGSPGHADALIAWICISVKYCKPAETQLLALFMKSSSTEKTQGKKNLP